ncbi:hypothetical protein [Shewanella sp. MEBiC00475]|uniref:hypothetical protein n=1 Tax=Shewanella sp. MEBiC00475 TaxID=2575361 RepID=UPI0010C064B9|nr:hypothetical protein [Shewanella sp. MEBiC00475]
MNVELPSGAIENFRSHLLSGFSSMKLAYKLYADEAISRDNDFAVSFDDFFHDWAQSNWELLVERVVCSPQESLVVYGRGSDYEVEAHSRVFFQKLKPTHEVICLAKESAIDFLTGASINLSKFDFDGFVSVEGGLYSIDCPLDHILFSEKDSTFDYKIVIIPIDQIKWSAKAIEI